VFLDKNEHITDRLFKAEISKISNMSALVFFFLVQIPLSRLNSGFAFLTCFIAWALDNQTKKWVYDIAGCIIRIDVKGFRILSS
jgi:hypothetical protein